MSRTAQWCGAEPEDPNSGTSDLELLNLANNDCHCGVSVVENMHTFDERLFSFSLEQLCTHFADLDVEHRLQYHYKYIELFT